MIGLTNTRIAAPETTCCPLPELGLTLGHSSDTVRQSADFARAAENGGLGIIGFGDSQSVFRELYCELTACALATERISLGSLVTNCQTRVAAVTSSAISTVHEIAAGRAFLGIGTGQSATAGAKVPRGTIDQLRDYLLTIRHIQRDARWQATGDEYPVPLSWEAESVPLIVHTNGPRSLAMAADVADGILLRHGDVSPSRLRERVSEVRAAVAAGGRSPEDFKVWLYTPGLVQDDRERALAELASLIAARAITLKPAECPEEHRDAWQRYVASYDYSRHASRAEPVNAESLRDLGLFDWMAERYSVVEDRVSMVKLLRYLGSIGVDAVVFGGAVDDKMSLIENLSLVQSSAGDTRSGV